MVKPIAFITVKIVISISIFNLYVICFRLVEISSFKITSVPSETMSLDTLTSAGTRTFRVEEVPAGELPLQEDEMLVPAAHFHKEAFSTFGSPFMLKVSLQHLLPLPSC